MMTTAVSLQQSDESSGDLERINSGPPPIFICLSAKVAPHSLNTSGRHSLGKRAITGKKQNRLTAECTII